ncbi:MAG: hypothetical protein QOI62_2308 [Solirubrobacteraceae bacterium]|jgi:hypothetical protein|nr:hypothetical protein [Solirubrobacteraceae bacterium]
MTSHRSKAYGIALHSLRELRPSKFTDAQMELFEQAADALLFTETVNGDTATLIARARAELDAIAAANRLMPETVERLKAELDAIGPLVVV